MRVAVPGRRDRRGAGEHGGTGRVAAVGQRAFETGPAEVGAGVAAVDLLPALAADVADDQLAGRVEGEAVGIAQAEGVDLGAVAVGIAVIEGIVGIAGAGQRVDAQDLAGEAVDVLGAHVEVRLERAVAGGDVEGTVGAKDEAVDRVGRAVDGETVGRRGSPSAMQL